MFFFFFSSRRRHTRWPRDWSSDVCSSDLKVERKRLHQRCLAGAARARRGDAPSRLSVRSPEEPSGREALMPRQRTLNFTGKQLGVLWKQLPERCRKEAVAIWARVIALTVQA